MTRPRAPRRLSDDEWIDLLVECAHDAFRLMILGLSVIDAEMDFQTERLFRTAIDLRADVSTQFPARLAIAAALGVVRDYLVEPLKTLNALRNRLAHGTIHNVTAADAETVRNAFTKAGILVAAEPGKASRKDLAAVSAGKQREMVIHGDFDDPTELLMILLTTARALIGRAGDEQYEGKRPPDQPDD